MNFLYKVDISETIW